MNSTQTMLHHHSTHKITMHTATKTLGALLALLLTGSFTYGQNIDIQDNVAVPEETKALIDEHKEEQAAIREDRRTVVDTLLAENPDASRDEVRAAIEEWNELNADRLEAQQVLREEIRADLQDVNGLPEAIRADIDAYRAESERLRQGRRAAVAAYKAANPDATPAEILEVVEAYNLENAEGIVTNRQLGRDIRQTIRREIRDNNSLPDELQAEIKTHHEAGISLKEGRRQAVAEFMESNTAATPEQIREVILAYNLEHAEAIALHRQQGVDIRQEVRGYMPAADSAKRKAARERMQDIRDRFIAASDQDKERRRDLIGLARRDRIEASKNNSIAQEQKDAARDLLKQNLR